MATLSAVGSAAASGIQPKAVHAGLNAVYSYYSITATLSTGDVITMCKLPDKARVMEVIVGSPDSNSASPGFYSVGTDASNTLLVVSASANATLIRMNTGFGSSIDISDDTAAANPYTNIKIFFTSGGTTGTKSGTLSLILLYTTDEGY